MNHLTRWMCPLLPMTVMICLIPTKGAGRRGHVAVQQSAEEAAQGEVRLRADGRSGSTHLQQSGVRFNSGGSGSFVSADGLVMTNHHVGADCLQKLSTQENAT